MRRARRPRVRRHLETISRRDHAALEPVLRHAIERWRADGWAIVGHPPRLRVAVLVPRKLPRPASPATTIALPASLGGGELKVAILATHRFTEPSTTSGPEPLAPGAGNDFLAPGAPVRGDGQRVGIGAVVSIDSRPCIITCGHAFSSSGSTLTTRDGATEIATLRTNLFTTAAPLDAAVFDATDDGVELLEGAPDASSWSASFHEPAPADNGSEATFWPTSSDGAVPFVSDVQAFSSCMPASIGCGYVMLDGCTSDGDSGSTLQLAGAYYGLASRRNGNFSFFTPLSEVRRRVEDIIGTQILPWRPS